MIMAVLGSSYSKFLVFAIVIAVYCFHAGYADDNPAEKAAKAFFCFDNKHIYSGCEDMYRLNVAGFINVPPYATDMFCSGPCFPETQRLLQCIDNALPDYIFYNKATVKDIRGVLRTGCSYGNRRGDFNVWRNLQWELNKARLPSISVLSFCTLILACYILLFH